MTSYMGFTERPVVPQLVLLDRAGNIHYATPRTGNAESLKEEVIETRIKELLEQSSHRRAAKP